MAVIARNKQQGGAAADGAGDGEGDFGGIARGWRAVDRQKNMIAGIKFRQRACTRMGQQRQRAVKPGGKLAYAVCTLTRPETSDIRSAFDEKTSDFTPLSLEFREGGCQSEGAEHLWWPQQTGGNGMYVALWKKRQG